VYFAARPSVFIFAKVFGVNKRLSLAERFYWQRPYKSAAWPINPAFSRNRSHRLLGGGLEFLHFPGMILARGIKIVSLAID
jgi:hypothetical protein